jgi:hypothetical protein
MKSIASTIYIRIIFLLTLLLLIMIATINWIFDPGGIYPKKYLLNVDNSLTIKSYINKLVESKYGLLTPKDEWNERDLKKTLAEHFVDYDCAIIGSSRAMQISSYRHNNSLEGFCLNINNFGVSGGSLEDYMAMSNIIVSNKSHMPNTIVFAIDPWSFNLGRDFRWSQYKQNYINMINILSNDNKFVDLASKKKILNLINYKYFKRSLDSMHKSKVKRIVEAPKFNHSVGLDFPVTLPDGSHIYSNKYIHKTAKTIKKISGFHSYKIEKEKYYQEHAIVLFTKLIKYLKNNNINVIFVLTPYHEKVWSIKEQPVVKAMKVIEKKVHALGKSLKVNVIGSYNSEVLGCDSAEFYDEMHPKSSCLAKLQNKVSFY